MLNYGICQKNKFDGDLVSTTKEVNYSAQN